MVKRTTRDIISDYIENEQWFDYTQKTTDEVEKNDVNKYMERKKVLQREIKTKIEKVEIKESIDKVKARKAAISAHRANKDMPQGISINKVERVRRS